MTILPRLSLDLSAWSASCVCLAQSLCGGSAWWIAAALACLAVSIVADQSQRRRLA